MTNTELEMLVRRTLGDIFKNKEVEIDIKPVRGNGLWAVVYDKYVVENRSMEGWHYEYARMGFGFPTFYAIAGEKNIVKAIHKRFDFYA